MNIRNAYLIIVAATCADGYSGTFPDCEIPKTLPGRTIAGIVIGSFFGFVGSVVGIILWKKCHSKKSSNEEGKTGKSSTPTQPIGIITFPFDCLFAYGIYMESFNLLIIITPFKFSL